MTRGISVFLFGLSPRRSGFNPRKIHLEYLAKKKGGDWVSFLLLCPPLFVSIIPSLSNTHSFIYHRRHINFVIDSVVE